jgi:hypothetical protein
MMQRAKRCAMLATLGVAAIAQARGEIDVSGPARTLHARAIIARDELGLPGEWGAHVESGHLFCVVGAPAEADHGDEVEVPVLVMVPADGPAKLAARVTIWRGEHQIASHEIVIERTIDRADLNGDGRVDSQDLTLLLAEWGAAERGSSPRGDIDGDGRVDGRDLSALVAAWHS